MIVNEVFFILQAHQPQADPRRRVPPPVGVKQTEQQGERPRCAEEREAAAVNEQQRLIHGH